MWMPRVVPPQPRVQSAAELRQSTGRPLRTGAGSDLAATVDFLETDLRKSNTMENYTMTSATRYTVLTIGMTSLAAAAPLSSALALDPVMRGELYSFHSNPVGTCPGLDWHVVVDGDNSVSGIVAWGRMKHFANITGNLNADHTFKLDAEEVGGPKKAIVTGNVTTGRATLSINGTGTGCDGKTMIIERAPSYSVGGDGG